MFLDISQIQSYKKKLIGKLVSHRKFTKICSSSHKILGSVPQKKRVVSNLQYLIASPLASITI
jgi:hypothetical protein